MQPLRFGSGEIVVVDQGSGAGDVAKRVRVQTLSAAVSLCRNDVARFDGCHLRDVAATSSRFRLGLVDD